jgi:hypothetical protein
VGGGGGIITCFGVPECLQKGIEVKYLLLKTLAGAAQMHDLAHNNLRRLGLASARLATVRHTCVRVRVSLSSALRGGGLCCDGKGAREYRQWQQLQRRLMVGSGHLIIKHCALRFLFMLSYALSAILNGCGATMSLGFCPPLYHLRICT